MPLKSLIWICKIDGFPELPFASPSDVSGGNVVCEQVFVREAPGFSSPSIYRNLLKIFDILAGG